MPETRLATKATTASEGRLYGEVLDGVGAGAEGAIEDVVVDLAYLAGSGAMYSSAGLRMAVPRERT
jgi:hypothetical protein